MHIKKDTVQRENHIFIYLLFSFVRMKTYYSFICSFLHITDFFFNNQFNHNTILIQFSRSIYMETATQVKQTIWFWLWRFGQYVNNNLIFSSC